MRLQNSVQKKEVGLLIYINFDYEIHVKVFWDSIYGTYTRSQVEYKAPELSPEKRGG